LATIPLETLTWLAVGVGAHTAVTLLLFLRFLEGRERTVLWWTGAYALFTLHVVAEAAAMRAALPWIFFARHVAFVAASLVMLTSLAVPWGRLARRSLLAGAVGLALLALAVSAAGARTGIWWLMAWPPSVLSGAAFLASAYFLRRAEGGIQELGAALLFWGLFLTGLHALDYPLLRPTAPLPGALASGLFTLLFGIGIVLRANRRVRELTILNAVVGALNRSPDQRGVLKESLQLLIDALGAPGGWMVLLDPTGAPRLQAAHMLPTVRAQDWEPTAESCQCREILRKGDLAEAKTVLNCCCVEHTGARRQHASIPLRTADRTLGVMNLLPPKTRQFNRHELSVLSVVGLQIGLAIERARLYEEIRDGDRLRRTLLARVLTMQEDERRWIARELHEEIGQMLSAFVMSLQMIERFLSGLPPEATRQMTYLRGVAESTLDEIRKIVGDLRPTLLDELGLLAAVSAHAHRVLDVAGADVEIETAGLGIRLPPPVETVLFRIIQESLTNIVRHAGATRVTLRIVRSDRTVRATIADNGVGFDPTWIPRADEARGMGVFAMRERAASMGGRVEVFSHPGKGTRIDVMLPSGDEPERPGNVAAIVADGSEHHSCLG
jgi:signal transduction histidine kinase